ncbi:hypothetical protein GCM10009111_09850 [Colwellia asteriadis]|uniref:TIGR02922 family protein n=1 Tax=Colwellia asteriadis TaxID=517723 RepID=A0ABN1L4Q2_9GAMM
MGEAKRTVTVIYCSDGELELFRETQRFALNFYGDMIIPERYKRGKTIVAVCEGEVEILNSIGDRLIAEYWP